MTLASVSPDFQLKQRIEPKCRFFLRIFRIECSDHPGRKVSCNQSAPGETTAKRRSGVPRSGRPTVVDAIAPRDS